MFVLGSTVLLPLGSQAGASAWLAILAGGALGLVFLRVYTQLDSLCEGQGLIVCAQKLLGRWLGGLVGLLYIWYGLHLGALVLGNVVDFLLVSIIPHTPNWAATLAVALVCAYGVRLRYGCGTSH